MIPFTPDDFPLPAFLDPILQRIQDTLPPPVYSALQTFLANFIALMSGLISILSTLLRTDFTQWNAQTIIPPLITILAAYLALLNLYNTTRWFVRTTFWFFKWGTILSVLMASASWFMAGWGQEVAAHGFTSAAMSALLNLANGQGQERDVPNERKHRYDTRSRTRATKPNAWDSFDQHRDWREQQAGEQEESEGSKLMKNIAKAAVEVFNNNGWLDAAKSVVEDATNEAKKSTNSEGQKGRSKAGSRSR